MRQPALHAVGVALLAALLALAGCLGAPPTGPGEASPTGRTTAATATPTPYPNETVPFPDGPKSRPALPETVDRETAESYAISHEYRYRYNELWDGPGTEVGMSEDSCTVESSTARGDGYEVVVRCVGYVNKPPGDATPGANETVTTVHYDLAPWTVRYYIDENSVVREEAG